MGWAVGGENLGFQSSVWILAPWLSQEVSGFFSGTDAFSWMAFASFVYLTSKHRHYLFEMDLVRLVKGV